MGILNSENFPLIFRIFQGKILEKPKNPENSGFFPEFSNNFRTFKGKFLKNQKILGKFQVVREFFKGKFLENRK